MSDIKRGNTVDLIVEFDIDEFAVADAQNVVLSVKQGNNVTDYEMSDLVIDELNNQIRKTFSQTETLAFAPNVGISIELYIMSDNGRRQCVVSMPVSVVDVIHKEVIPWQ